MTPTCFLLFWCVLEIVSYAFSLLLIAILFWPTIRSRGEDQHARSAVEQVGGAAGAADSGRRSRQKCG